MLSKRQYILIITLAVLLGILTAIWQISFLAAAVLIFLSVTLTTYIPFVWYIYFSRDIDKIGDYLKKRARQPILHFYYSLANADEAETEQALSTLKKKYKSPRMTAVVTAAYAARHDTLSSVKQCIPLIKDHSVKDYYETLLKIEEGQLVDAENMIPSLQKEWMREVAEAELLHKKGQPEAARSHEEKAIDLTKGIQLYSLVKYYT
jgi:hypothetical protein